MRAFFLLSLVAVAYGMPRTDDIPRPIIIPTNPIDIVRPIIPHSDSLLNSAIIGEITRPTHVDNGIPSDLTSQIPIELPAEITPLVQIIVNIVKKAEVSIMPETVVPEVDSVVPLAPIFPEENKPDFGVFPNHPDLTRPSEQGIDAEHLRPSAPVRPEIGIFPMQPEITRPTQGVNPDFLRPNAPLDIIY